jgi:V/A-type H+/Na+-transporting ATPase subunit A
MKVIGEEGTSFEDFEIYLKAEFLDAVYIQQNGFDPVDSATAPDRQKYVFNLLYETVLVKEFNIKDKTMARQFFYNLRQAFIDLNYKEWGSQSFKTQQEKIEALLKEIPNETSVH